LKAEEQLTGELSDLQTDSRRLNSLVKDLQDQSSPSKEASPSHELLSFRVDHPSIKNSLSDKDFVIVDLETQLETEQTRTMELEATVGKAQVLIVKLNDENNKLTSELEQALIDKQDLAQLLQVCQSQRTADYDSVSFEHVKAASSEDDLTAALAAKAALEKRLRELEGDFDGLEEKLETIAKYSRMLEEQSKGLAIQNEHLERETGLKEREIEELRATQGKVEELAEGLRESYNRLIMHSSANPVPLLASLAKMKADESQAELRTMVAWFSKIVTDVNQRASALGKRCARSVSSLRAQVETKTMEVHELAGQLRRSMLQTCQWKELYQAVTTQLGAVKTTESTGELRSCLSDTFDNYRTDIALVRRLFEEHQPWVDDKAASSVCVQTESDAEAVPTLSVSWVHSYSLESNLRACSKDVACQDEECSLESRACPQVALVLDADCQVKSSLQVVHCHSFQIQVPEASEVYAESSQDSSVCDGIADLINDLDAFLSEDFPFKVEIGQLSCELQGPVTRLVDSVKLIRQQSLNQDIRINALFAEICGVLSEAGIKTSRFSAKPNRDFKELSKDLVATLRTGLGHLSSKEDSMKTAQIGRVCEKMESHLSKVSRSCMILKSRTSGSSLHEVVCLSDAVTLVSQDLKFLSSLFCKTDEPISSTLKRVRSLFSSVN
jgi:hypothetical protein